MSWDQEYQLALSDVLRRGVDQQTGAKVGGEPVVARSKFNVAVSHDMADGFPLLSLRKVSFRTVALETAFFIQGQTNAYWLVVRGCNIWKKWARSDGSLGPVYGSQWRNWGSKAFRDDRIDQIRNAASDLDFALRLDTDRCRRRIIVQAWNPDEVEAMALPPCHTEFQLLPLGGRVHLRFTMRSCDLVTGLPHNMAGYALILAMFCDAVGAIPGEVACQITDAHVYTNQIPAAEEMLRREPRTCPLLARSACRLTSRELLDHYDPADPALSPWSVVGYDPHPSIDIGEVAE